MKTLFFVIFILIAAGCSDSNRKNAEISQPLLTPAIGAEEVEITKLKKSIKAVEPFFKPMGKPAADEWLANFDETGQTFEQYLSSDPTLPTSERKTIYIQPIGKFSEPQSRTIKLAAEYMEGFFGLPVRMLKEKQFDGNLSQKNYRINPQLKSKQIRSGYVLEEILQPNLPTDAAALIAFTSEDLYPDATMNYVFGQANLESRVSVWSLYRLAADTDFKLFLIRTLKVATHETGHMFSMRHCTKYECGMSGTNHLGETDKHPLDACPECMAKICWMTGYEPQKRYQKLAEFCRKQGLTEESANFDAKAKALMSIK